MSLKKVILVFKTHFDIGFTKLSREIIEDYATDMLDKVKVTCDATQSLDDLRYVWTMPAWPLYEIQKHTDERRTSYIDDLIQRKQLRWHALPFTSHYDFCGVEEMVWGMRYGKALSEKYKLPLSRAAKMTDVPGHGRFLPEMLADAGVHFLHLGCNEFIKSPDVPPIFWWEAPSGKRVLTMYNNGYGTSILPPKDWKFGTWMALMNTNDNCGPQSAELVQSIVERIREACPQAEIVSGSLEDFWDAVKDENLSDLPVVKGDLADTWIHGIAAYPRETAMMRRLRGRLLRANCMIAQLPEGPRRERMQAEIAKAYDAMVLYAEHTWGLDVKTSLGAIPDYDQFDAYRDNPRCRRMEESWKEQSDRAQTAEKACRAVEEALGLKNDKAENSMKEEALHGECVLQNDRFCVEFSANTGKIHSVTDRQRGKCILRERGDAGVFSYRYDRYGADDMTEYLRTAARRFSDWGVLDYGRGQYPECDHVAIVPEFEGCVRRGDTVELRYVMPDKQKVNVSMTANAGAPLHVKIELKGKHASPYVESGSFCMPFPWDDAKYFINKTGSVLDAEKDIVGNANHAFYALERFIGVQGDSTLTGIVSHDAPLVSIGENGVFVFRKEYQKNAPELRFCLFDNMWGTNFPQWIEGDMSFEFDLLTKNADDVDGLYADACALTEPESPKPFPFELGVGLRLTNVFAEGNELVLHVQSLKNTASENYVRRDGWIFREENIMGEPNGNVWTDGVETTFMPYDFRIFRAKSIDAKA